MKLRKGLEESDFIKSNMASFGEYEQLVRKWCKKHNMVWVMEEFKELFDDIRKMDRCLEDKNG